MRGFNTEEHLLALAWTKIRTRSRNAMFDFNLHCGKCDEQFANNKFSLVTSIRSHPTLIIARDQDHARELSILIPMMRFLPFLNQRHDAYQNHISKKRVQIRCGISAWILMSSTIDYNCILKISVSFSCNDHIPSFDCHVQEHYPDCNNLWHRSLPQMYTNAR